LAVDIGGTKTLIALFSKRGRVIRRYKFKTSWQKEKFVRDLVIVLRHFAEFDLNAVVVAVPGVVQKNCSVRLGNRDWGDFSLVKVMQLCSSVQSILKTMLISQQFMSPTGFRARPCFLPSLPALAAGLLSKATSSRNQRASSLATKFISLVKSLRSGRTSRLPLPSRKISISMPPLISELRCNF